MTTLPPTAPKATGTRRERSMIGAARIVSGFYMAVGIVGVLRVGTTGETHELVGFTIHPLTAVVWLVLGLVGVALSVVARRARAYLIAIGAIMLAWILLALITTGDATDFLTTDPPVIALHAVLGLVSLGVALGPTPEFVEKALALPEAGEPDEGPEPGGVISGGIGAPPRRDP